MKDKVKCERVIEKLELEKYFDTQNLEFQIYQYEKGELLCQPCNSDDRVQIVIEGTVNIYHIRDDGSKYFIAMNEGIYLLGDMEFMNLIASALAAKLGIVANYVRIIRT